MPAFFKKAMNKALNFGFVGCFFSILHVTAHILPLMLYVLCCLWAMYAFLFCCSLKEWNSGLLKAQLTFANDLCGARILLLVVMISVFCQKQYVKCHSRYLCLWFCLLFKHFCCICNIVSTIWWYFVGGYLLVLGFCCSCLVFILWLAEISFFFKLFLLQYLRYFTCAWGGGQACISRVHVQYSLLILNFWHFSFAITWRFLWSSA